MLYLKSELPSLLSDYLKWFDFYGTCLDILSWLFSFSLALMNLYDAVVLIIPAVTFPVLVTISVNIPSYNLRSSKGVPFSATFP